MAKGKKTKKKWSRSGFGGMGKYMKLLIPVAGGAADEFVSGMTVMGFQVPNGAGSALIGHFAKDDITRGIGLYQIGRSIPHYFGAGGVNAVSGFIGQV